MMDDLTFEKLIGAVAVILVLIGAYNTIMAAVKTHREEKRIRQSPLTDITNRLEKHDEMLARDKMRLDKLEIQSKDLDAQSRIMMRGMKALLSHELNNNSVDKLREAMTEIDEFLINR